MSELAAVVVVPVVVPVVVLVVVPVVAPVVVVERKNLPTVSLQMGSSEVAEADMVVR